MGGQLGGELLFNQAATDAQFLDRIEVPQEGHVGISWIGAGNFAAATLGSPILFSGFPGLLGATHQGQGGPKQQSFDVAARRAKAHIEPARHFIHWHGDRKERITSIWSGCRKDRRIVASKEGTHLLASAPHGGGGGHDLGPQAIAATELINHCLVEASHRAEGA